MRRALLVWFLFTIICCKALSYSSAESTLTSKADGFGSKVMESKKEGEALHLGNAEKGKKVIYQIKKANKGVYGGGDLLRPRSKKSRASSLALKSSPLAIWALAIGFLFSVLFWMPN